MQAQIVEQVEYYFSDAHILKDAFLLKHARRNRDGFISLKLITSFKKVHFKKII
jgi:la-related protein 6